jgi:hypothetical protein
MENSRTMLNYLSNATLGSVRRRVRVFRSHIDSRGKPFVSGHPRIHGLFQPNSATSRNRAENTGRNSVRGERILKGKDHRVSSAQWLTSQLPARGINKKLGPDNHIPGPNLFTWYCSPKPQFRLCKCYWQAQRHRPRSYRVCVLSVSRRPPRGVSPHPFRPPDKN